MTILETLAKIMNDSASCLASTGEIRLKYAVLSLTAKIGFTLASRKEYLNSFLTQKAEHTVSAACFAIWN